MKLPNPELETSVHLNSALGRFLPSFFLVSRALEVGSSESEEFVGQSFDFSSLSLHEHTHWCQFAGTSWGLLSLSAKQSKIAYLIDRESQFPNLAALTKGIRFNDDFFVHRDDVHRLTPEVISFTQNYLLRQIGHELLSTGSEHLFSLSMAHESVRHSLEKVFREHEARLGFNVDWENCLKGFGPVELPEKWQISVLHLLEGQARVGEFGYLAGLVSAYGRQMGVDVDQALNKLSHGDRYWKAFNLFSALSGFEPSDIQSSERAFAAFCVVVDISLSPQIAPYAGASGSMPDWASFYPCNRFITLSQEIGDLMPHFDADDPQSHQELAEQLCNRVGWPNPNELAIACEANISAVIPDSEFSYPVQLQQDPAEVDMWELLCVLHRKFCQLRQRIPFYIANVALSSCGTLSQKSARYTVGGQLPWLEAPLQTRGQSRDLLVSWEFPVANRFLVTSLISFILEDCILRDRPVEYDRLPFDPPESILDDVWEILGAQLQIRRTDYEVDAGNCTPD